jgi:hypothetical protein
VDSTTVTTPDPGSPEGVLLERITFGAAQSIAPPLAQALASVDVDHFTNALTARLEAHVLGKRLPSLTHSASRQLGWEFPASTWQHFKQRHAHSWWLRWLVDRRPVRTSTHTRTVTLTTTWEQHVGFPWASHVFPGKEVLVHDVTGLGPAVRYVSPPVDVWTPAKAQEIDKALGL